MAKFPWDVAFKKINIIINYFHPFPEQVLVFTCLQYSFEKNSVGKREIARNEQFLFFSQNFSVLQRNFPPFNQIQNCRLQYSFSLEES